MWYAFPRRVHHQGCTCRRCWGKFTFRSTHNQSLYRYTSFGGGERAFPPRLRRRREEIAVGARHADSSSRGKAFTHRRECSRRKIAYKLIAESCFACAPRRWNLRRVSDNNEMNLSKRKDIRVSTGDSNLRTVCCREYPKYPGISDRNFTDKSFDRFGINSFLTVGAKYISKLVIKKCQ